MAVGPDIGATRVFGRSIDFGKTAGDYRAFRAGFPTEFFDALRSRNYVRPGQRALDLGTGTGTVARGLSRMGLIVTGIDPAQSLLAEATSLDREAGVTISYRVGTAEDLTESDASIEIVTAGQCWHWFDRPKAAAEIARVLSPRGRVIIAHFDWLPLAGNVVEATEELILGYNPQWTLAGGTGLYPAWLRDLAEASFVQLETFSFDTDVSYSHEAWRGRIRASAGVKASLAAPEVARFDEALGQLLAERFPADPLSIPHRIWVATGVRG
jgi:2-polyprenyl-3-methyl-5-hydroxy-6-metoxy-1,4-benzoquinol methylase